MGIENGELPDADHVAESIGLSIFNGLINAVYGSLTNLVPRLEYSLFNGTSDIDLGTSSTGIMVVDDTTVTDGLLLEKRNVFIGELYDDYDSSVDTAKWEEDGTETETTTYIRVSGLGKYLRTHTSTGLDLKQASGWSEVAFKCAGSWATGGGTTADAQNINVYLTDGSNDVLIGSFGMNTGTRSSGSLTAGYMVIKIDNTNEEAYMSKAQVGTVNDTGGNDWGSAIDISSLTKYCLKFTTPSPSGSGPSANVDVYNVVYAKASDFSGGNELVFATNDFSPGVTINNVVPCLVFNEDEFSSVSHAVKAGGVWDSVENSKICYLSNTGTSLYYKVTITDSDTDRLLKISMLGIQYNIHT